MTKPRHPLAYGDVFESLAPAQGRGNFYARFLFSTLLFYLSPASPLELIRDLERLSLCTHIHRRCTLYRYFHVISSSIFSHMPLDLFTLSIITGVPVPFKGNPVKSSHLCSESACR